MSALTIPALLAARADAIPDRTLLRFAERDLSFGQVQDESLALAGGLRALGVEQGDLVALLLPNRPEFVLTWFALNLLGAAQAPVNTAFRGPGLSHALNLTRARVLVVDEELLEPLAAVADELGEIKHVVVLGDRDRFASALPAAWRVLAFDELAAARPAATRLPSAEDLAMVLFTSGTTGRSKGCMLSHRYAVRQAQVFAEQMQLRADDVLYSPFALFHVDAAIFTVMPALELGAVAALGRRFSASGFWDEVRAFGATVFDFMGATLTMLHKREREAGDADNPVRLAWGVPMPGWAEDFEQRFGLRLTELYGLTDAGIVIYSPPDEPRRPGSCGRAVTPFEVRVEDDEILIRSDEPGLLMDGYFGMPDETREAFRDGWLHTGDLARRDADGWFYFVGRRKEVIRRRGENISAFEVEEVVGSHPDVLEVAAYGVPSALLEEEVMVAVVPRPGRAIDPAQLLEHCVPRMARHMLPRYVDVVDALPRTPTEKIEKYRLVDRGVTATSWDREESEVGTCR